ncbi:MAG: protein-disulfide reductase DsbD family protein [Pseudomonadota bacterium]|uniref:protein-disulfide reductase DsbD family protein n=1 Tax=Fodinicurvata fenggangensis TaxID=1121830 RepID=UPI00054EA66A|nr:protein-disulfide reductase DsbD domain-containing protein [Fodinicurvata fenggangensis]
MDALSRPWAMLPWLLLALLLPLSNALAEAGDWAENEHSRVRLISAQDAVGESEALSLGVQVELDPGWKTYWRSPGDAGYPISLDWSGSENLKEARLDWPVPHRFELFDLQTFGYEEEVVFPLTLVPETPGQPMKLRATADYLVCEEVCIPFEERLSLDLPSGEAGSARETFLIELYRARVPQGPEQSPLRIEQASFAQQDGENGRLLVEATAEQPMESPDLLVEGAEGYRFGKPEVSLQQDGHSARLVLPVTGRPASAETGLSERELTLTLTDRDHGLEQRLVPGRASAGPATAAAPAASSGNLLLYVGIALLGGLILNVMPCVLPVLSIKLLSLVRHGGAERRKIRLSFLASTAGILSFFILLALGAIALKLAGASVGWGIQFQQPLFLLIIGLVLVLFAANLFGLFEISLPGRLSTAAAQAGQGREGLSGAYLTGAFAAVLATPCSAPFVGTAVGFALTRGPMEILAIFLALGTGLALPYLLIAAWPALAGALPKPGRWMVVLRRILGLALLASALWVLMVLSVQLSALAAWLSGILFALLLFVLWLRHRNQLPYGPAVGIAGIIAVGALGIALPGMPFGEGPSSSTAAPQSTAAGEVDWRSFAPDEIAREVERGRVVFVDVTAEWCITCQVNKTLVLDGAPVADLLAEDAVVTMRGDWTKPDQRISDYLARHGRYGIPFNIVYGPGAPEGIVLPEVLSEGRVLAAIEEAAGGEVAALQ